MGNGEIMEILRKVNEMKKRVLGGIRNAGSLNAA